MFKNHARRQLSRLHSDPMAAYSNYPQLTNCQNEHEMIELVKETFPWCVVDKVRQVNCPEMYGMYLLRKEEMLLERTAVYEHTFYHVTTESRGVESLTYGLDWRRTKRSRFGRGVCFSDDADYADFFADNTSGENRRVIIVCTVLVANKARINSGYGLKIPPGTADTTVSSTGRVYVKYNDYEFYPMCLVYYRRRPEHLSLSIYFKGNKKNNINGQNNTVANYWSQQQEQQEQQRKQEEQQRKQKELQRQQEKEQERWRQRQQQQQRKQKELQRQQEEEEEEEEMWRHRQWQQRQQEEQFTRVDNGCAIL